MKKKPSCEKCSNKKCIRTGKPCSKVEKRLKTKGVFSSDFIRPERSSKKRRDGHGRWREVPFSSLTDNFDPNIWRDIPYI